MKIVWVSLILVVFVVGGTCFAQATSARDKYYNELSKIIEANVDNPQACVKGVESFLNNSKKLIDDMVKEQITTLDEPLDYESMMTEAAKTTTPQARFNQAMAKLSEKYPEAGQKIMMLNIRALIPPIDEKK